MTLLPGENLSRRFFLQELSLGLGGVALSTLLHSASFAKGSASPYTRPNSKKAFPQFAPRAKHVIFLFMAGGGRACRRPEATWPARRNTRDLGR
jgi:hypothetical protein